MCWSRTQSVLSFLAMCSLTVAAGCGAANPTGKEVQGAKVGGVLLHDGKPVKFLKDETIRVSFVQGTGDAQVAASAEVKPEDGSFAIDGPTGQGIPPGKYKVGLASDIYGGSGEENANRFEKLFNAEVTPLTADVGTEPNQRFEIELSKRSVTKK